MSGSNLFKRWSYRFFAPGTLLREKYEAFKQLLTHDSRCHEQMADFQELFHSGQPEDLASIRKRFSRLSAEVAGMIECLETMAPVRYVTLREYHKKFDFSARFQLAPPALDFGPPFALPLDEVSAGDGRAGNKAGHLATLKNVLGAPVPDGFIVTANAFHYFIEYNNLRPQIDSLLAGLRIDSPQVVQEVSASLTTLILEAELPADIEEAMLERFDSELAADQNGPELLAAVRSSALGEDGVCSFAGQYTSIIGVTREGLTAAYIQVLSSKYAPEALLYRISHGLCDEGAAMAVLIQKMVPAASSGVLYTRNPLQEEEGGDDCLHLHAVAGQGAALVGGEVRPDHYQVSREEAATVLSATIRQAPLLGDDQIGLLVSWGLRMEAYFQGPQDIEWASTGDGQLLFLQCRPLRLIAPSPPSAPPSQKEGGELAILLDGCERAAGGVAAGPVYRLDPGHPLVNIPTGAVLVCGDTPPDFVQVIHRLAAVVSCRGSRACHFATVAREFGVPLLVAGDQALTRLAHEQLVTVDGERGQVYDGALAHLREAGSKQKDSHYQDLLRGVLRWITPLALIDPAADNFQPEGCRSLHDIIRFCHEKGMQAMFAAPRPGSGRGARRLVAGIPLTVYLFDVGGGIAEQAAASSEVQVGEIVSLPFQALWRGLTHPGVQWRKRAFDWEAHGQSMLADGIGAPDSGFAFASYAVLGADYLHFNIRFGYHFTIVDALCGGKDSENYCLLRFAGGGGDFSQRSLRISFLSQVLERLSFNVEQKGDLLEARVGAVNREELCRRLDMLGRLLGAAKLMDMVLTDPAMTLQYVEDFLAGRYSFSKEG